MSCPMTGDLARAITLAGLPGSYAAVSRPQIRPERQWAGCLIRRLGAGQRVGLPSGPTRRQQAERWTVDKVCRHHSVGHPTKVMRRHGADQTQPPAAAVKPPPSGLWERPGLVTRLAGKTGRRTGQGN